MNKEESNLVSHAIAELNLLMPEPRSAYDQLCYDSVIKMVRAFSEDGHSGFSASWTVSVLEKLLRFRPLLPLTGEDSEWGDVGNGLFQNKRDSSVFKQDGNAYWLDGKVFSDDGGKTWFSNGDSCAPVAFPWTRPETKRVILDAPTTE